MRFDKMTSRLQQALADAQSLALGKDHTAVETVHLLDSCDLVLSDSGGLQEEGPALGKPVLVLRDDTERPEAVEAGVACIVGTHPETIVGTAARLLDDPAAYAAMARQRSPFGDGRASLRIAEAIVRGAPALAGT